MSSAERVLSKAVSAELLLAMYERYGGLVWAHVATEHLSSLEPRQVLAFIKEIGLYGALTEANLIARSVENVKSCLVAF